jgi:hypothetical protein
MTYNLTQEQKVVNSAKLNQLQQEIQEAVYDGLNNSKLFELLRGYGLDDRLLQIHVFIDLKKVRLSDDIKDPEIKDALQAIPGEYLIIAGCDLCSQGCCA